MSSKDLLQFGDPWCSFEAYPSGFFTGAPARLSNGLVYRAFTPGERAGAEWVNQALWEAQDAAKSVAVDSLSRDFDAGDVFAAPANMDLRCLSFDENTGEVFVGGTTNAGNPAAYSLLTTRRGFVNALPGGITGTVSLHSIGCVARAKAKTAGVRRYFVVSDGTAYSLDVATGSLVTIGAGGSGGLLPAGQQQAFYSKAADRVIFAGVPSSGTTLRINRLQVGDSVYDAGQTFTVAAAVNTMTMVWASEDYDGMPLGGGTTVGFTAFGSPGVNTHYSYRAGGSTNFAQTTNPLSALMPSGHVEIIGLIYDRPRRKFVVCWAQRAAPFAWGFATSSDGVTWTSAPGVQTWQSIQAFTAELGLSGAQPISFTRHGALWVVLCGQPSAAAVRPLVSPDEGATWYRVNEYVNAANLPSPVGSPGPFVPRLLSTPRGLVYNAYAPTASAWGGPIWVSQLSGLGGVPL